MATIKKRDLDDVEKKPYRNIILSKKLCQALRQVKADQYS